MKFLWFALCFVSAVAFVSAQRGPPGAQQGQQYGQVCESQRVIQFKSNRMHMICNSVFSPNNKTRLKHDEPKKWYGGVNHKSRSLTPTSKNFRNNGNHQQWPENVCTPVWWSRSDWFKMVNYRWRTRFDSWVKWHGEIMNWKWSSKKSQESANRCLITTGNRHFFLQKNHFFIFEFLINGCFSDVNWRSKLWHAPKMVFKSDKSNWANLCPGLNSKCLLAWLDSMQCFE